MKIIFLSDIHGLYDNLEFIDRLMLKNNFDKLVVLGDLYYPGFNYSDKLKIRNVEVKDFLVKHRNNLICMRGNCDSDVDIKASDFPICNGLSLLHVDGLDIYITHGNEYSLEKNHKFHGKGILVYGHEHIPYIKKTSDMVYINTGSISFPRNQNLPTYVIYENRKFTIFDINGAIVDEIEL